MDKFPKFIIENGNLVLGRVTYHRELVVNKYNVNGGGWYRIPKEELDGLLIIIFSDSSEDFGAARLEDIKECVKNKKIFSDNKLQRNISDRHKFAYDTKTEIIYL